jgi:hypothetical protein
MKVTIIAAALTLAATQANATSAICRALGVPLAYNANLLEKTIHEETMMEPMVEHWVGPMPKYLEDKVMATLIRDSSTRRNLVASLRVAREAGCLSDPDTSFEENQLRMADNNDDVIRKIREIQKKAPR